MAFSITMDNPPVNTEWSTINCARFDMWQTVTLLELKNKEMTTGWGVTEGGFRGSRRDWERQSRQIHKGKAGSLLHLPAVYRTQVLACSTLSIHVGWMNKQKMKRWSMKKPNIIKSGRWECTWYVGEWQLDQSSTESLNKKVEGRHAGKAGTCPLNLHSILGLLLAHCTGSDVLLVCLPL